MRVCVCVYRRKGFPRTPLCRQYTCSGEGLNVLIPTSHTCFSATHLFPPTWYTCATRGSRPIMLKGPLGLHPPPLHSPPLHSFVVAYLTLSPRFACPSDIALCPACLQNDFSSYKRAFHYVRSHRADGEKLDKEINGKARTRCPPPRRDTQPRNAGKWSDVIKRIIDHHQGGTTGRHHSVVHEPGPEVLGSVLGPQSANPFVLGSQGSASPVLG